MRIVLLCLPMLILALGGISCERWTSNSSLVFDSHNLELGEVLVGPPVSAKFGYMNTGTAACSVDDVKTSCGCTVVEGIGKAIGPGEKGSLNVEIRTGGMKPGQRRQVTMLAMVDGKPAKLAVELDPKAGMALAKKSLTLSKESMYRDTLRIERDFYNAEQFSEVKVMAPPGYAVKELLRTADAVEWEISLALDEWSENGNDVLRIEGPYFKQYLPLSVVDPPATVSVVPRSFVFMADRETAEPQKASAQTFRLKQSDGKKAEVIDVRIPDSMKGVLGWKRTADDPTSFELEVVSMPQKSLVETEAIVVVSSPTLANVEKKVAVFVGSVSR